MGTPCTLLKIKQIHKDLYIIEDMPDINCLTPTYYFQTKISEISSMCRIAAVVTSDEARKRSLMFFRAPHDAGPINL